MTEKNQEELLRPPRLISKQGKQLPKLPLLTSSCGTVKKKNGVRIFSNSLKGAVVSFQDVAEKATNKKQASFQQDNDTKPIREAIQSLFLTTFHEFEPFSEAQKDAAADQVNKVNSFLPTLVRRLSELGRSLFDAEHCHFFLSGQDAQLTGHPSSLSDEELLRQPSVAHLVEETRNCLLQEREGLFYSAFEEIIGHYKVTPTEQKRLNTVAYAASTRSSVVIDDATKEGYFHACLQRRSTFSFTKVRCSTDDRLKPSEKRDIAYALFFPSASAVMTIPLSTLNHSSNESLTGVIELSRANRRREVKANKNAQHSANVGFGAMRPQAEAFGESIGFVLSTALRVSNIMKEWKLAVVNQMSFRSIVEKLRSLGNMLRTQENLFTEPDPDVLVSMIARCATLVVDASGTSIFSFQKATEESTMVKLLTTYCRDEDIQVQSNADGFHFYLNQSPIFSQLFSSKQAKVVTQKACEQDRSIRIDGTIEYAVFMPIRHPHGGDPIGVMQTIVKRGCTFEPNVDLPLLDICTTLCTGLVVRAQALQESQLSLTQARCQLDQQRLLLELTKSVNSELDITKVISKTIAATRELLRAEKCSLFLVDLSSNELWTRFIDTDVEIRIPMGTGIVGYVAMSGEVVSIEDAYNDHRFNKSVDKQTGFRTKAILAMPVRNHAQEVLGVLQMINKKAEPTEPAVFSSSDERLLEDFSVHLSMAIENSTRYRDTKGALDAAIRAKKWHEHVLSASLEAHRRKQILLQLESNLVEDKTPHPPSLSDRSVVTLEMGWELVRNLMARARELLQADRFTVFLMDTPTGCLWSKLAEGTHQDIRIPLGNGIAGIVALTGEPRNIVDAYKDEHFNADIDKKTSYKTKSILCMPIFAVEYLDPADVANDHTLAVSPAPGDNGPPLSQRRTSIVTLSSPATGAKRLGKHASRCIGVVQMINKASMNPQRPGVFTPEDEEILKAFNVNASLILSDSFRRGWQGDSIPQNDLNVIAAPSTVPELEKLGQDRKDSFGRLGEILSIIRDVTSTLDIYTVTRTIIQGARELLRAERCSLFLLDDKTNTLKTKFSEGATEITVKLGEGIAGFVAQTGEVANVLDAYKDPRFNSTVDVKTGYKTKSILSAPIVAARGEVIGVAQLINKQSPATGFSKDDEQLLKAISAQASVAVENARQFEETLRMNRIMETIIRALPGAVFLFDAEHLIVLCSKDDSELQSSMGIPSGLASATKTRRLMEWLEKEYPDMSKAVRAALRKLDTRQIGQHSIVTQDKPQAMRLPNGIAHVPFRAIGIVNLRGERLAALLCQPVWPDVASKSTRPVLQRPLKKKQKGRAHGRRDTGLLQKECMIAAIRFQQDHLLTTDAISALLDHSAEVAEALGGTRELSPCGAVVILVKESAGQCVPADESYAVVQSLIERLLAETECPIHAVLQRGLLHEQSISENHNQNYCFSNTVALSLSVLTHLANFPSGLYVCESFKDKMIADKLSWRQVVFAGSNSCLAAVQPPFPKFFLKSDKITSSNAAAERKWDRAMQAMSNDEQLAALQLLMDSTSLGTTRTELETFYVRAIHCSAMREEKTNELPV